MICYFIGIKNTNYLYNKNTLTENSFNLRLPEGKPESHVINLKNECQNFTCAENSTVNGRI